ncbi:MAG: hypothetical protein HRT62_17400 [Epibacterium sp.]|nr:hypothetical protein [Epibacterium sp.]
MPWELVGQRRAGIAIRKLEHEVRVIPTAYGKPFVKRSKNDIARAKTRVEAALRSSMHFSMRDDLAILDHLLSSGA